METVADVVDKMGRVAVGAGRRAAGAPDSSIVSDGLVATRHGRVVSVEVAGLAARRFDLGSASMARFLFAQLTKVA